MLRGAIIGFGAVAANGHWPAYAKSSEAKIVAVVDRTETRRQAARESIPGVATFARIDELPEGVDFVDICTPPALHGEPIRAALARGWNVLCEKPLLLDSGELQGVRALAQESDRLVVPVHNWKYAPIVRAATNALRAGAVGELREVQIETLRIEDCAAVDPAHPNWRRDPAISGGGILMDHGWHAIYLARHWFGEDPIEIEAELHRAANGIEDEATLTLEFPRGRATIFLTWRAERRGNTMRLRGDRGEIAIDDDTLRIGDEETRFESALSAGSHHADWFAAMLPDVLASFRSPKNAQAAFDEAALCLSAIRRAYEIA
ncbi:MAG TPA: Gfo/Idh/MocA family oxidoreductase [Chthoniobacterales bacterium]|nr:Gfo/Idh/MocA family oxidoreductase [Chthoniobacterales bacterium]